MEILTETLTDEIAKFLIKRGGITEKSWLRWGDKNRLTRSIRYLYLSERGIAVDKMAKEITSEPQFDTYEESEVISEIIDFTETYPNRAALNKYFSKRRKEQKTTVTKSKIDSPFVKSDNTCLIDSLKKELTTTQIIEEMKDLRSDPQSYFGRLLTQTACKKDLFSQSIEEQKKIAESIIQELSVTKKSTILVPVSNIIKPLKNERVYNSSDSKCLIDSLKKELTTTQIIEEMKDLRSNPKSYFGRLLTQTACKKDLLSLPIEEQKKIASSIIKDLTKRKKTRTPPEKPVDIRKGIQRLVLWGLGVVALRKIW